MKGAYALTHVSLYKPNQATKDAVKILESRSDRAVYYTTLQVVHDAASKLDNWRYTRN